MPSRRSRYNNCWYLPGTGPVLRERYNNNRAAYYANYKLRLSEEENLKYHEDGTRDFATLERRTLRRAEWRAYVDPYKVAGKMAFDALLISLSTQQRVLTDETDFVLAAIDFEGDESKIGGIHGYGLAILDTREILSRNQGIRTDPTIDAANYRIARHNQGFLFGDTHRIEIEDLPSTILEGLTIDSGDQGLRKVVLVGHGIEADLKTLQHLDINLAEDLPQVFGFIDTADLARQSLGRFPTLRTLLELLKIPFRKDFLHCAGNDAVLTMQALLAMVYRQSKTMCPAWPALDLYRLAYRELEIAVKVKNEPRDWERSLVDGNGYGIDLWDRAYLNRRLRKLFIQKENIIH